MKHRVRSYSSINFHGSCNCKREKFLEVVRMYITENKKVFRAATFMQESNWTTLWRRKCQQGLSQPLVLAVQ
jgi:hypothetical protein